MKLIEEMAWLPRPPDNFRSVVRALRSAPDVTEKQVRQIATSALNLTQLEMLANASLLVKDVERIQVSLVSNATTDLLLPAIQATAPRHGIWIKADGSSFGTFVSEALDPASQTRQRNNDFIVLALDHRAFSFKPCPGDLTRAETMVRQAIQTVSQLASAFHSANGATVVVQTLAPPPLSSFGSLDTQLPGTMQWMIARFNKLICELRDAHILLLDVCHIASMVGLAEWHDPVQWNLGKFAFSHRFIPLYADALCRVIMAARGKAKKCLVLDLDNTLWGGVIGDDGMTGIRLSQGDAVGEAFLEIQQTALALRARGIVLAVCSKNNDEVARQVFREHPDMVLREEHIAVFQANWKDKASNLKAIAHALNIDVSALVLLDDNPAERQQVRDELYEVGIPELPASPEFYPLMLLAAGYFDSVHYTSEDSARAEQYQANVARSVTLGAAIDIGEYLRSLQMEAHVSRFDLVGRNRIAQLINKTNQFNLTTKRYTEADVAAFENDPAVLGLQVRLKDRFGDNGMISVVICKKAGTDWIIDTWLMSCRVLNRRLEELMLKVLCSLTHENGIDRLIGHYRPTPKNSIVKDHYRNLGFTLVSENTEESVWELMCDSRDRVEVPIALYLDEGLSEAIVSVVHK